MEKKYLVDKKSGVLKEQMTMRPPAFQHYTDGGWQQEWEVYKKHILSLATIPLANPNEWTEGRIYNEDEVEVRLEKIKTAGKINWGLSGTDTCNYAYLKPKPEPKEDEQEKFLMDAYWLLELAPTEKIWIETMKSKYTLTPKK